MAVISVKERHQERRSSFDGTKWTHLRIFLVKTDDAADGTVVAVTAVPGPGATHPKDGSARVTKIDADTHENSDKHFLIRVEYTSTSLIALPADPLKRPPEISFGYIDATEPYFLDESDPPKPAGVNSAGSHFDELPERETGDLTLTITVNEATFDVIGMDTIKHTTNLVPVVIDGTTYAPGVLKLSAPTAQKVQERIEEDGAVRLATYYKVTYTIKAKAGGWLDKKLDIGREELIPGSDASKPKKVLPIVDAAGLPVQKPWPLDGAGRKKPNPTDAPATLTSKPYKDRNWLTLKPFMPETWEA